MSETQPKSLDDIVQQAQSLTPQARMEFILRACDTDAELRARALARLESRQQWLTDDGLMAEAMPGSATAQPAEQFGPYRVLRSLGHGGMGEVFLAERADDQYRQQVAIKLVRRGLLSKAVHSRLRLERQILASLDHPNIARLFDGGTTTDGMPYIVMEYVDGEPIDSYCDRLCLPVAERLKLFMTVCAAVHRAHQNLVVHRDLKPSNILVTKTGEPKLLDFGIAKLLDEREGMHTIAVTQLDVRVMTPDHASPEQILGLSITTASDIYVLGVLLYELLTGCKPFALQGNRLAELEHAICETDPTPPSVAIASMIRVRPAEADFLAKQRGVSPTKLRRELWGDLDNIVLMAMRKEPERRYSSAERLAADVNRYLQQLPVQARPTAWTYRASKFVRRNTLVVGLSSLFLVALIVFAVSTYIQAQHVKHERDVANAAREHAQREQKRAEAVSSFLIDSFKVSDPARARGKEITAREILDNGAARIERGLSTQPALQATLLDTIGNVYLNLGLPTAAQPLIERGLQVRQSLYGPENPEVAQSLGSLNRAFEAQGEFQKAEELARRSLAMNQKLSGSNSLETAGSWCQLGLILYRRFDLANAEHSFRYCIDIRIVHLGRLHELVAAPLDSLALIAWERRDYETAERLYREALQIDKRLHGDDHPQYIRHLHNLANVLRDRGDTNEAEGLFKEVITSWGRVLGPEHPETISALLNFGQLMMDRGDLDAAQEIFEDVLAKDRKAGGPDTDRVGYDLSRLGRVAYLKRDFSKAQQHYRDALATYQKALPVTHPYVAAANLMLGRCLIALNEPSEAERALQSALGSMETNFGAMSTWVALTEAALAKSWVMQGRAKDAEPVLLETYPIIAKSQRAEDREMAAQVRTWIEDLYRSQNRPQAAAEYFAKVAKQ